MEIVFNNFQEFFDKIAKLEIQKDCPNLQKFVALSISISVGCKCHKANKILSTNNLYKSLGAALSQIEKDFLKLKLGAPIIAKESGNVVWEIS